MLEGKSRLQCTVRVIDDVQLSDAAIRTLLNVNVKKCVCYDIYNTFVCAYIYITCIQYIQNISYMPSFNIFCIKE